MRVIVGADHGAVALKTRIIAHLRKRGVEVHDIGTHTEDSVDYPDIAEAACSRFLAGGFDFGILCCGTGIGISIAANKIAGIRCGLVQDSVASRLSREHNDVNFLAFGGRVVYPEAVETIIDSYMSASFAGDRHARRVNKIMALERK